MNIFLSSKCLQRTFIYQQLQHLGYEFLIGIYPLMIEGMSFKWVTRNLSMQFQDGAIEVHVKPTCCQSFWALFLFIYECFYCCFNII